MTKLLLGSLFFFLHNFLFAQRIITDPWLENKYENDWEEYNLKGKVKSVDETIFYLDTLTNKKEEVIYYPPYNYKLNLAFNSNSKIVNYQSYSEDVNGRAFKHEFEIFYENNVFVKRKLLYNKKTSILYYKYDSILNKDVQITVDESGKLISKSFQIIDSLRLLISNQRLDSLGKLIDKTNYYYENNLLIKEELISNDSSQWSYYYKYDKINPNKRAVTFMGSRGEIIFISLREVDSNKNLVYDSIYNDRDSFYQVTKTIYNSNLDEEIVNEISSGKKIEYVYKYIYDKQNNWIEKKIYINNRLEYIIERKIKYFK